MKNISKNRLKAIKILELIADKLGNENIFDKNWFEFENMVTNIINKESN